MRSAFVHGLHVFVRNVCRRGVSACQVFMGPVLLAPGTWPLTTTGLPLDTSAVTPTTSPYLVTYRVEDPFGRVAIISRKVRTFWCMSTFGCMFLRCACSFRGTSAVQFVSCMLHVWALPAWRCQRCHWTSSDPAYCTFWGCTGWRLSAFTARAGFHFFLTFWSVHILCAQVFVVDPCSAPEFTCPASTPLSCSVGGSCALSGGGSTGGGGTASVDTDRVPPVISVRPVSFGSLSVGFSVSWRFLGHGSRLSQQPAAHPAIDACSTLVAAWITALFLLCLPVGSQPPTTR